MTLVVSIQVSAEDIIAASKAAITSPLTPIGKSSRIKVEKDSSGAIAGKSILAPIPMNATIKATGMRINAVIQTDDRATCSFFAQNSLEYISGPTIYVDPTRITSVIRSIQVNCELTGNEK